MYHMILTVKELTGSSSCLEIVVAVQDNNPLLTANRNQATECINCVWIKEMDAATHIKFGGPSTSLLVPKYQLSNITVLVWQCPVTHLSLKTEVSHLKYSNTSKLYLPLFQMHLLPYSTFWNRKLKFGQSWWF